MLTEMCISELEDVARDPSCGGTPGASVVQESPHPYSGSLSLTSVYASLELKVCE